MDLTAIVAGLLVIGDGLSSVERTLEERPWLLVPFVLVGSYLLARLIQWWGGRHLDGRTSADGTNGTFARSVLEEAYRPFAITIALVGIYVSLDLLDAVGYSNVVVPGMITVLVVLWMRTSVRVGNRWIEHVQASDSTYEFAPIFKNFWTVTVTIGGLFLLLSVWNVDVTPFLASAGVLGIVIGFAAQDGISNLIGGVALYFDNTYKIGDVILVEDGRRGTVTDIGIRSTTVLSTDNRIISVPNSVLNSTQVVNESAPQRHVRIDLPFTVAYGTAYGDVERILLQVCADSSLVREQPAPRVLFDAFGDSALEFVVRAYISHPLTEKRAIDQMNRRAADAFAEEGIEVPFPQRTISYLDDSAEHRYEEEGEVSADIEDHPGEPDDQQSVSEQQSVSDR